MEYSAGERFEPFAKVEAEPETGELILHKGENQPATEKCELDGTYAFWIRIRCRNVSLLSELEFADIRVTSQTERSVPDVTFAGGIEQRGEYLPLANRWDFMRKFISRRSRHCPRKTLRSPCRSG